MERADQLFLDYVCGGDARYKPGQVLGPRVMADYELVLIIEGHVQYEACGETHLLEVGSVVLARPGFRERYAWDTNGWSRHAFFHFGIKAIPRTWPKPENWPVSCLQPDPLIGALFRSVLARTNRPGVLPFAAPSALVCRLVQTLIDLLLDESGSPGGFNMPERPNPVALALMRMRKVLEEEPQHKLSLTELAKIARVSEKHLSRVFLQWIGHPPMETLRLMRLQLALVLLIRSNYAVKEVAAQCGFEDPLHFSRCFTAAFGRSPRQVRLDLKLGIAPPSNPLPMDVTPQGQW